MKHLVRNALVVALGVGIVGCEWQGGSSDNSWNDSKSIANFNGSYRGNGGYLVSEYTIASAGDSSSSSSTNSSTGTYVNRSETQSKHAQLNAVIAGVATYTPIKKGTFSVHGTGSVAGLSVHDDGAGGLTGDSFATPAASAVSVSGFIVYETGSWSITLSGGGSLDVTTDFQLNYSQESSSSSGASTSSGTSPGSSGVSIYVFNVQQDGNRLKIIDNNGSIYNGSLGDIRTTGNLGADSQGSMAVNGDQLIAQFHASGSSAAGVNVDMAGVFQGTVQGVTVVSEKSGSTITRKTSFALADRRIQGTWIEQGGKTGDINGLAQSSVNVSVATVITNTPTF